MTRSKPGVVRKKYGVLVVHKRLRASLLALLLVVATVLVGSAMSPDAHALTTRSTPGPAAGAPGQGLVQASRVSVLGRAWASDTDIVWDLLPTQNGLVVAAGAVSSGAAMRAVANLAVAGVDTRRWIGTACVLHGTHTLAVAFATMESVNREESFDGGGYAATVDLVTGATRYAASIHPSLAYFSPSCGADGRATYTSYEKSQAVTRLSLVDASGAVRETCSSQHQLTSAVSLTTGDFVVARGQDLAAVSCGGALSVLATAPGQVSNLSVDTDGGVAYTYDLGRRTVAAELNTTSGTSAVWGDAAIGSIGLSLSARQGLVVRSPGFRAAPGATITARVARAGRFSAPSLDGSLFVDADGSGATLSTTQGDLSGTPLSITNAAGQRASLTLAPATPTTPLARSSAPTSRPAVTAGSPSTDNLPCAISRNDPSIMAYQPSVRQAEWAVDLAVNGQLTQTHPANYRNYGLPAYSPQGYFPRPTLSTGGTVPPQIMLGILANESNLWQASSHVTRGGYGNPLTGDVYGRGSTSVIDTGASDCGYGIAQVTDKMRTGDQSITLQRAIAQDYETNIAAGLQILGEKWNQLHSYSPKISVNDDDPQWVENWYFALWAYNSGVQPDADNDNTTGCVPGPQCTDIDGYWGLGWFNNPANPIYPSGRHLFNSSGSDAMTPGMWPYQERVIGWAAFPFYDSDGTYRQASWNSDSNRSSAVAPPITLCTSANGCVWSSGSGYCSLSRLHCWTHTALTWKSCASSCGTASVRYVAMDSRPADPASTDPAVCDTTGLPTNAVVVDDQQGTSRYSPCGGVTTKGSFAFTFAADSHGNYPAHIDLHQVNGGLNGHYWFTHTEQAVDSTLVSGTWTFPPSVTGWGDVYVHVPALGSTSVQAKYTVKDKASGDTRFRIIDTYWGKNAWIPLGAMKLSSGSTVSETSVAPHEGGLHDISWDAVAFVPRPTKPAHFVVALGDSYSSGEAVPPFDTTAENSPTNACHRSANAYARTMKIPGQTVSASAPVNDFAFLACSGAVIESMTGKANSPVIPSATPGPDYQNGQELQLDRGYLTTDTDIVTLTIGGNDARFADIITFCIANSLLYCPDLTLPGDPSPLKSYEPKVVTNLISPKLRVAINEIHRLSPNARILVGTYPALFTGRPDDGGCFTIGPDVGAWIKGVTGTMTGMINDETSAGRARGISVTTVDVQPGFAGHEPCQPDPFLNSVNVQHVEYSFHPNNAGQRTYAAAFSAAL